MNLSRYNFVMSEKQIKRREANTPAHLPNIPEPLARVFSARGVKHIDEIDYSLKSLLPPDTLFGVPEAVEMLAEAISADASILIVGDFDADGATSCAVAIKALRAMGAKNINYLVPNRFEFGYGLSPEIVGVAATQQPDIIITVDNGISSVDGVHAAQALGMSVIVTDHHLPGEELPTAEVIINPNLPNDKFPSKNLAGVGVIFYLMLALRRYLRDVGWFQSSNIAEPNMSQYLDLVALGTVADVVPLDRNNRTLVQQGLLRIRSGKACAGINALLQVGKRLPSRISSTDLGFTVGPRLNAAGRLEDMSIGIECLLTDDVGKAMQLANKLDQLNRERRELEQSMKQDALQLVSNIQVNIENKPSAYCLYDKSWHQGVVGLVASRIKDQTNRPVVVLAPADELKPDEEWKGSVRSVEGVHIRDALARLATLYPEVITKFGGHAMAAGLSLPAKNLDKFANKFVQVMEQITQEKDWRQIVWTDGELQSEYLTVESVQTIQQSSPWGQGFPEPLFDGEFEVVDSRVVGETHAKLKLKATGSNNVIDAICFGYLERHGELPKGMISIAYRPDINEYQDRVSVQLIISHIE